jgi:hypothetical protein
MEAKRTEPVADARRLPLAAVRLVSRMGREAVACYWCNRPANAVGIRTGADDVIRACELCTRDYLHVR